jgi:hypothetical protein
MFKCLHAGVARPAVPPTHVQGLFAFAFSVSAKIWLSVVEPDFWHMLVTTCLCLHGSPNPFNTSGEILGSFDKSPRGSWFFPDPILSPPLVAPLLSWAMQHRVLDLCIHGIQPKSENMWYEVGFQGPLLSRRGSQGSIVQTPPACTTSVIGGPTRRAPWRSFTVDAVGSGDYKLPARHPAEKSAPDQEPQELAGHDTMIVRPTVELAATGTSVLTGR